MKASVYIATSLDGFIARENGDLDWLDAVERPSGEDYGYAAFMATVDAIVMGRATFEKVLSFGVWPYRPKPVVVLASREVLIPPKLAKAAEWMSGTPTEVLERLGSRGIGHVYVDGGRTIQRFLEAGAIQRMIITRVPVLIGRGIPLFGPLRHDIALHHVQTRGYPTGLVQSEYTIVG